MSSAHFQVHIRSFEQGGSDHYGQRQHYRCQAKGMHPRKICEPHFAISCRIGPFAKSRQWEEICFLALLPLLHSR